MRLFVLVFSFALLLGAGVLPAAADKTGGALAAIKQLPKGEAKRIARIEAHEGTPAPERWHVLVYDPKDENGLHEYVVAGGEVVASRNISQFAESLKPDEIIGSSPLKIDSDQVASLAQQYALANGVNIASLNYVLKKEGADAAPLWDVTCIDELGKELGHVIVSAGKGNVVSHEGFTAEPGAAIQMADAQSTEENAGNEGVRHHGRKQPRARNVSAPTAEPQKKDVFSRIGNSLSKFFTGH